MTWKVSSVALRPLPTECWSPNFLATAAGLYLASQSTELTRTDQRDLPDHLAQAMASCRHFVARATRGVSDALTLDWAVGYWILSGLFRQEPRVDQAWLAAAIGETLSRTSGTLKPSASRAGWPAAAAASTA
jgi:hypothetical protein